jgi:arsenate reductase-like glutaredoxin family protein
MALQAYQIAFIRVNAEELTAEELAKCTGEKVDAVRRFCQANKITYKKVGCKRKRTNARTEGERVRPQGNRNRPPATYSNHSPYGIAS